LKGIKAIEERKAGFLALIPAAINIFHISKDKLKKELK
jgi:hypothetical protein